MDLTIEFDAKFIPRIVDNGCNSDVMGDVDDDGEDSDSDDDEMSPQETEMAILERAHDEDGESSSVLFEGGAFQESHDHAEIVTVLPTTNTTVRRLPKGFRIKDSEARSHAHVRHRSGVKTKVITGNVRTAIRTKQKGERKKKKTEDNPENAQSAADNVAVQSSADAIAPQASADDDVVAKGVQAMKDLVHEGLILDAPDTSVCWLCRKWFSPPEAKEGHVCDTTRKVHVDLTTHGLMCAAHCVRSGAHEVIERGTAKESDSSSAYLEKVRLGIHPSTRASYTPVIFEPGWARRPKRGSGKGKSYIGPYRQRIYDMFLAGEVDKRHRKAPTQMLEVLALENPGIIALPGYGEISSFVGSLISRAKKGKTGLPKARAPPITTEQAEEVRALDKLWEDEGRRYTKPVLHAEWKRRHTTVVNGNSVVSPDFPSVGRFNALVAQQRKFRRGEAGAGAGGLLRVVPLAGRANRAGEPPSSKVGSTFRKHFTGYGTFVGTVSIFYQTTGRHKITYPDGDAEDLDWTELSDLLAGVG